MDDESVMVRLIALLGQRDSPVDGVEDYCTFLASALAERGIELKLVRVDWHERGWLRSLWKLWIDAAAWRESWILVQYTALAWSRRGLPLGFLGIVEILRWRHLRCAVIFHDPCGISGPRWIDRIRGAWQNGVVRWLHARGDKSIFADPLDRIPWLKSNDTKAVFIPIGANIPERANRTRAVPRSNQPEKVVTVFCVSSPPHLARELDDIACAARCASQDGSLIRLIFIGRGTAEAKEEIARVFRNDPIQVLNLGIRSAEDISQTIAESDALVCVRGRLYLRRGSAIAGIACGTPIVGYAGVAEGTPLAEAGLALVPYGDKAALGRALIKVLRDDGYWQELHARSIQAQTKYFSWKSIGTRLARALEITTA